MGSPLAQCRVAFASSEEASTEIDLSGYLVRGLFSPDGHALGTITVESRLPDLLGPPGANKAALVPIELADVDEAATLVRFEADWPLWLTTFHVEHPRDESFELFLLIEHRG